MDDLLPQTLGNWSVTTCQIGVYVLSAQDVNGGKNMASDAGYTLARALLAARLNQDAGACVVTDTFDGKTFEEILTAADNLLIKYHYVGTGEVLSNKTKVKEEKQDYNYALTLAGIIDDFNNGDLCDGDPSH